MSRIAVLHPQCSRVGGAIQMALQTVHALQKQGHTVTLYTFEKSDACFPDLQTGINIEKWHKKIGGKLISIITLAFHLRHFDIIIANNPPMQCVAALSKVFSIKGKRQNAKSKKEDHNSKKIHHFELGIFHFELSTLWTIWWHHHVPWYFQPKVGNTNTKDKVQNTKWWNIIINPLLKFVDCRLKITKCVKNFAERNFVIPFIDQMIATSHFVAEKIQEYCGRESVVVHPVIRGVDSLSLIVTSYDTEKVSTPERGTNNDERITIFTHGRLEVGKGIDMLTRVFDKVKNSDKATLSRGDAGKAEGFNIGKTNPPIENGITPPLDRGASQINLIIFGTGSLETKLREEGIDVRPFRGEETFSELSTGKYGHVIGVYCSSIDAFGMSSLESQMAGFPTIIMDRGGAREAILSDDGDQAVGYLVHSEEELLGTISRYVQNKILEKQMSNVNFSHKRDYFSTERLSSDLLSIITKTDQ